MSENQTTSEHSTTLMQLQALRQQGAIGEQMFAQLKAKLLSGNAQDQQGAQKDIQNLQAAPAGQTPPAKKSMGWLFKLFIVAIMAVIITIIYLVVSMPNAPEDERNTARQNMDEQVEIMLPKGAQDVVPTFTPGESINEAFKARQAAQDGLLAKDGDQQVATTATPAAPTAALVSPRNNEHDGGGSAQKAANKPKERDQIKDLLQHKQKEAAKKKAASSENIDNLF